MVLDSRPSDAIALALRADCPIYVDMEVIKASQHTLPTDESEEPELAGNEEEWPDVIGEAGVVGDPTGPDHAIGPTAGNADELAVEL